MFRRVWEALDQPRVAWGLAGTLIGLNLLLGAALVIVAWRVSHAGY